MTAEKALTNRALRPGELPPLQLQAAYLYAIGANDQAIAKECSVALSTVKRWKRTELFRDAADRFVREVERQNARQASGMVAGALTYLHDVMRDDKQNVRTRMDAAKALIGARPLTHIDTREPVPVLPKSPPTAQDKEGEPIPEAELEDIFRLMLEAEQYNRERAHQERARLAVADEYGDDEDDEDEDDDLEDYDAVLDHTGHVVIPGQVERD